MREPEPLSLLAYQEVGHGCTDNITGKSCCIQATQHPGYSLGETVWNSINLTRQKQSFLSHQSTDDCNSNPRLTISIILLG